MATGRARLPRRYIGAYHELQTWGDDIRYAACLWCDGRFRRIGRRLKQASDAQWAEYEDGQGRVYDVDESRYPMPAWQRHMPKPSDGTRGARKRAHQAAKKAGKV